MQRNYRWFFAFVFSTTLLCIYVFALSAVYIKLLIDNAGAPQHRTVWQAMGESVGACVLMGYAFLAIWFVGGLTVFHTYLILSNQVTTASQTWSGLSYIQMLCMAAAKLCSKLRKL